MAVFLPPPKRPTLNIETAHKTNLEVIFTTLHTHIYYGTQEPTTVYHDVWIRRQPNVKNRLRNFYLHLAITTRNTCKTIIADDAHSRTRL